MARLIAPVQLALESTGPVLVDQVAVRLALCAAESIRLIVVRPLRASVPLANCHRLLAFIRAIISSTACFAVVGRLAAPWCSANRILRWFWASPLLKLFHVTHPTESHLSVVRRLPAAFDLANACGRLALLGAETSCLAIPTLVRAFGVCARCFCCFCCCCFCCFAWRTCLSRPQQNEAAWARLPELALLAAETAWLIIPRLILARLRELTGAEIALRALLRTMPTWGAVP